MNTKKIKKTVKKSLQKTKGLAQEKEHALEKIAKMELQKVKKHLANTSRDVEGYIKNNPAKATAISTSIGAALGGALAFLFSGTKKTKKKK